MKSSTNPTIPKPIVTNARGISLSAGSFPEPPCDITNVIVGSKDLSTFFDYDLETANSLNQGNEEILDDNKWVILEEEYISYLVGKESPKYKTIDKLPSNISMVKQNNGYHI